MARDRLTIIALAVIAYTLATVVHEGVGHGGACVLSGGKPELMTSMQFQGDDRGLSTAAVKFIAAGGTIANLIFAAVAIMLLARRADTTWFFLWWATTRSGVLRGDRVSYPRHLVVYVELGDGTRACRVLDLPRGCGTEAVVVRLR